jgi:hypothetical protein
VKANGGNFGFLNQGLEGVAKQVGGFLRSTQLVGEDQVLVCPSRTQAQPLLSLSNPVLSESLDGHRGQLDPSP